MECSYEFGEGGGVGRMLSFVILFITRDVEFC